MPGLASAVQDLHRDHHSFPDALSPEPIDVVYTWVDDTWPGHRDTQRALASDRHDENPNRTRDNLGLLRYGMRGLSMHMPWVRNVYVITMRPQVPPWLDVQHPRVRVVHHDQIISSEHLPTFNSFAILSHLHLLEALSERFVYLDDDFLLGAPVSRADLLGDGAADPVYFERRYAPDPRWMHSPRKSPWDAGRAYTNKLLDDAFGPTRRLDVGHVPMLLRRSLWAQMIERWPDDFARTRTSRFRKRYNVVPEFMYAHYAIAEGIARPVPADVSARASHYVAITNSDLKARYDTFQLARRRAKFCALNDDFGHHPNPRVVRRWRECLERVWPMPSEWERPP